MQIATARLKLHSSSDVPVSGITPAEAIVLHFLHSKNAGGAALSGVKVTGDAKEGDKKRTPKQELARLKAKYPAETVDKLFPGATPQLPDKFDELPDEVLGEQPPADEEQPEEPAKRGSGETAKKGQEKGE